MKEAVAKLKISIATLALLAVPAFAVGGTAVAQPNVEESLCQGGDQVQLGDDVDCTDVEGEDQLNDLITNIVNILSIIVGVVAVVMIIVGGFRYITSGGDSGNVSGAKNTILYAIVGLVIVALAQFIVRFVLSKSTDLTS
jgi:hypothetical protein